MLKLYFGNAAAIISSVLILGFAAFLSIVTVNRANINHWGIFVLCMFFLGLAMSIFSGVKDRMGSPDALIPVKGWAMTTLGILGALAFVIGILSIFIRKQGFWQFGFYAISADIIIKIIIVEAIRISAYFKP